VAVVRLWRLRRRIRWWWQRLRRRYVLTVPEWAVVVAAVGLTIIFLAGVIYSVVGEAPFLAVGAGGRPSLVAAYRLDVQTWSETLLIAVYYAVTAVGLVLVYLGISEFSHRRGDVRRVATLLVVGTVLFVVGVLLLEYTFRLKRGA